MVLSCACLLWFPLSVVALPWMWTWTWSIGTIIAGIGGMLGLIARRGSPYRVGGYDLAGAGSVIGWTAVSVGVLALAIFKLGTYVDAGTS